MQNGGFERLGKLRQIEYGNCNTVIAEESRCTSKKRKREATERSGKRNKAKGIKLLMWMP